MKWAKRLACAALAAAFACAAVTPAAALSAEEIKAPAAVLMEAETGQVLFEKNPHEKRAAASITKVMTLLLVMEALDSGRLRLEDPVTTSAHAASMGGSDIWLEEGEVMSVDDLIKATVIMSANDAAVALAEAVAGTEEAFVAQMNRRAQELGMADTTFCNCNGLDEEGHLTSAYDVALMSAALMRHERIFSYAGTWIDTLRGGETQLVNTNKLLKTYSGITGLKTGTTSQAGSCISATAERDGMALIAVVLGSANTSDRFSSAAALLDYGFANWAMASPQPPELPELPVEKGMQPFVPLETAPAGRLLVAKGREGDVTCELNLPEKLTAPVEKGDAAGSVRYLLDGAALQETEILAAQSVAPVTFSSAFLRLWDAFLRA